MPVLRKHCMVFNAYRYIKLIFSVSLLELASKMQNKNKFSSSYHRTTSPLAGGFLTGKLTAGNAAGTRFEAGSRMTGGRSWYDKPVMRP